MRHGNPPPGGPEARRPAASRGVPARQGLKPVHTGRTAKVQVGFFLLGEILPPALRQIDSGQKVVGLGSRGVGPNRSLQKLHGGGKILPERLDPGQLRQGEVIGGLDPKRSLQMVARLVQSLEREEYRAEARKIDWPVDFSIGALKFAPLAHTQWMWGQIAAKLDRLARGEVADGASRRACHRQPSLR